MAFIAFTRLRSLWHALRLENGPNRPLESPQIPPGALQVQLKLHCWANAEEANNSIPAVTARTKRRLYTDIPNWPFSGEGYARRRTDPICHA